MAQLKNRDAFEDIFQARPATCATCGAFAMYQSTYELLPKLLRPRLRK